MNKNVVPDWRKDLERRIEELVAIGYEREEAENMAIAEYYGDDDGTTSALTRRRFWRMG
jgi:hypothetical protein